jgi:hypothetical protein
MFAMIVTAITWLMNWATWSWAAQDSQQRRKKNANCSYPLALAWLVALPGSTFPTNYIVQVTVRPMSADPTVAFGLKFRQQNAQNGGQGWGGYAFLIAQNGAWQFNRYDDDGTRHSLVTGQWAQSVSGAQILDVAIDGSTFSLYLNGKLVTTQRDASYTAGVLNLAVEPGGTVSFSKLGIFALP